MFYAMLFIMGDPVGGSFMRFLNGSTLKHRDIKEVRVQMAYSYFYKYFGKSAQKFVLNPNSCPVFFGYGAKKPFMFHSDQWIFQLTQHPKCYVEAFDCEHWVPLEVPEKVN